MTLSQTKQKRAGREGTTTTAKNKTGTTPSNQTRRQAGGLNKLKKAIRCNQSSSLLMTLPWITCKLQWSQWPIDGDLQTIPVTHIEAGHKRLYACTRPYLPQGSLRSVNFSPLFPAECCLMRFVPFEAFNFSLLRRTNA